MMPYLRKHALLPADAEQRSPPSSIPASQASQPLSFSAIVLHLRCARCLCVSTPS
jgi:hypothetical protein